jgi:hypothetical protein
MVKKKFIDKKNSTTYTLTWGSASGGQEEDDAASMSQGSASRYNCDDGQSFYGSESAYG